MGVPKVYRSRGQLINNSFSFTDVISGSAIQEFLLGNTVDSSGTGDYHLATNAFYSHAIYTSIGFPTGASSFTKEWDNDFDITIGIPRTIQGDAIFNMNTYLTLTGGSTVSYYMIYKVRKYNATIGEVDLVSFQTDTVTTTTATNKRLYASIITIPKTSFTKGDVLRFTIEVWGKNTSVNPAVFSIQIDPMNRTGIMGSGEVSRATFACPFIINT